MENRKITERQAMVLVETVIGTTLFILSIASLIFAYGWHITDKPVVGISIVFFGFLGYILFRLKWSEVGKISTDDKIDYTNKLLEAIARKSGVDIDLLKRNIEKEAKK